MRLLFATVPADGHVNPLTGLAVHLRAEGHDVRWYAGPAYRARLSELGIPVLPYVQAAEITGANIADRFPERAALRGPKLLAFDAEQFFVAQVANQFRDLGALRADFPFDALVCDTGFYALKFVAEAMRVPVYAVHVAPLMSGQGVPPPFFGLRPATGPLSWARHRVTRAMVNATLKPGTLRYNAMLATEGIAPVDALLDVAAGAASRIFLVGAPGLEFPQSEPPANAEYVGVLPPAPGPDQALPAVIHDSRVPVVVVSQGTVDNADPSKLIEPALRALAGDPYLVIVVTGGRHTDDLRRRYARPNVVVEDFLDFDTLLPHADAFVCNGGFGSVLAALRHGVPVVVAGTREGKNDVNARVAYRRLGLDLRTERPRPAAIARAVTRVLGDSAIAANVAVVRAELAAYHPFTTIERAIAPLTRSGSAR